MSAAGFRRLAARIRVSEDPDVVNRTWIVDSWHSGRPLAESRADGSRPGAERSDEVGRAAATASSTTSGSPRSVPSLFGILKECLVEPGDQVKAGQVLGRLEDEDARAELQLREMEANSDSISA